MRAPATADRIRAFMRALGREARGPGDVFLTGGGCAVLKGWRPSTIDVDLNLDPEPPGAMAAIARLKDELDLNIELAAPDQFVPPLPGWRDRSPSIDTVGAVRFWHYDFYAQALAKIERDHAIDRVDVASMVRDGLVEPATLARHFAAIEPDLIRYPAVDADVLRARVEAFVRGGAAAGG